MIRNVMIYGFPYTIESVEEFNGSFLVKLKNVNGDNCSGVFNKQEFEMLKKEGKLERWF